MNIGTLSEIIQGEQEIMKALEFAREEQDIKHTVETLTRLANGARDAGKNEERIKMLLRGLGRLNRAVRQLKETEVSV